MRFYRFDLQARTDSLCSVIHNMKTHSARLSSMILDTYTIVAHADYGFVSGFLDPHNNYARAGMFVCINNCFAHDSKKLRSGFVIRHDERSFYFQAAGSRPDFSNNQVLQRGHQLRHTDVQRMQAPRDITGIVGRVVDQFFDFFNVLYGNDAMILQPHRGRVRHERHRRQMLANAVVQFPPDLLLFAIADFQDFAFQTFASRNFVL